MRLRINESIDGIILIVGEEEEDESEWKGLTQTMKRTFETQLSKVEVKLKQIQDEKSSAKKEIA